jgi:hypothetical protein
MKTGENGQAEKGPSPATLWNLFTTKNVINTLTAFLNEGFFD